MKNKAFMLAAPSSGSGKTMMTMGMLRLLVKRGLRPASFKCGPDYIDPMFHRTVIGVEASNIDLFFSDKDTALKLFQENSEGFDISVVEGVMGYYDGLSAASSEGVVLPCGRSPRPACNNGGKRQRPERFLAGSPQGHGRV